MVCPKCGEQNGPEAKFCGHCGATLAPPAPPAQAQPQWGAISGPQTPPVAAAAQPRPQWQGTPGPQSPPPAGSWQPAQPTWASQGEARAAASPERVNPIVIVGLLVAAVIIPLLGAGAAVLAGMSYRSSSNDSRRQAGNVLIGVGTVMGIIWLLLFLDAAASSGFDTF